MIDRRNEGVPCNPQVRIQSGAVIVRRLCGLAVLSPDVAQHFTDLGIEVVQNQWVLELKEECD